ncbi:ATP-dependent helicase HrpB [Paenibacillus sp. FSL W8-1187]|uniref:ATP-dependent helicase HrpB n=1 Tax=Paenibacillus pasadenensis TaxID=217090 RepID=A0A2N5N703_9BACL|nr:ATP-dependent helicase HrpB [Paenibacillus pasadenensis]PLT46095.1 ATP-dependent helicase HrpB [Paenibacillus pasadenensis]
MEGSGRLPVDEILPGLLDALETQGRAVLVAQPGAGKTTRVPLALLGAGWLGGRKVLMLEPRRLAARSAAAYMARQLGEEPGGTVGYRVRLDTKVGPRTRVEVVTEGILTRLLQEDPALEAYGAVLFDEFHERHLHSDLGLALCLQSAALLREDLRLVVMSATLDAGRVAELLGGAPVLASEGRQYPVETRHRPRPAGSRLEQAAAAAALEALREQEGDVLVFLPGIADIRRTESELRRVGLPAGVDARQLHGGMPLQAQDEAVAACAPGRRKIVLATSIAESSLTVAGVRAVVDAGLMRVPRFSPRTGMTRLETVPVSQASADQRRGRAGRTAPGRCWRLWSEEAHRLLPAYGTPELLEADLAPLALELAAWGTADPAELDWLDAPPSGAYEQACSLLERLGALTAERRITPHGRRMAALGGHPRLAHMALEAERLGWSEAACELAALLGERDLLRGERSADLRLRVEALRAAGRGGGSGGDPALAAAAARIAAEARQWRRSLEAMRRDGSAAERRAAASAPGADRRRAAPAAGTERTPGGEAGRTAGEASPRGSSMPSAARGAEQPDIGLLLALAYPDRIAQRRPDGRYVLAIGRGAALANVQPISSSAYLVAADLDDAGTESRIDLAAPVELAALEALLPELFEPEQTVEWDAAAQAVRSRRQTRLGAIVVREAQLDRPDPERVTAALLQGIRSEGLRLLPWTRQTRQLQARMQLMHAVRPDWPDASDEVLLATLEDWLAPHAAGIRSASGLQKLPLAEALDSRLGWERRRQLDSYAPTHLTVPSGSRVPVDYSDPQAPFLAVRLQELFGMKETPRVGGGRLPVVLHLLSPAQRPVQVTRDLESFWSTTYFEVRKELKVRYPKHYWPENPLEAQATSRVRPRSPG